jgi:hypothetical protein
MLEGSCNAKLHYSAIYRENLKRPSNSRRGMVELTEREDVLRFRVTRLVIVKFCIDGISE